MKCWVLHGGLVHQLPQLIGIQASACPVPHMEHLYGAGGGRFVSNRTVDLVLAIAFSIEQQAHLLSKLFGFICDRAAAGHVSERLNGGHDATKLLFGLLEAALLMDVPADFVEVMESPRRNLNAKSHDVSGDAAPPL